MRLITCLATACIAIGLCFSASAAQAGQQLKLGMEEVAGSVQDTYAQFFKKQLEAAVPDWELEVYPVGVLGDANDMAEQVMNGVLEFDMPTGHMASFIPMVRIYSVPYIWSTDMEVNKKIMTESKAIFDMLGAAYAKNNMRLLALFPEGWQQWSSNKPLRALSDFKNLRIRIMADPLLGEIYKNYGANPLQVSYAEIYSALQLKQLDANIQPLFAHEEMSFYEQQNYFTNPYEMPFISAFVANKAWFDGLDKAKQDAIMKTAREAVVHTIAAADTMNAERKEIMQKKKPALTFHELTAEEQKPFREKAGLVEKKFIEMAGPDGEKLLTALKAEVAAAEQARK